MSDSRRNVLIRSVATLAGDIATGLAVASACVWLIGALVALALSQYVVHPAVSLLLSDRKLDVGIDAASALAKFVLQAGSSWSEQLFAKLRPAFQAV